MKKQNRTKFIFVVGGVMSGVGKGITAASIGQILSNKGYNLSIIKIDPYINIDAGTMNPVEHGEVFVTADGDETDQDLGNYERFLNKNIYRENYMTTGRVYQTVIERERNLAYDGKCVQVVPHIPLEVIARIKKAAKKTEADIMVIEIGGTVGEYENLLFLEAARIMKLNNPKDVLFVMVSYLPIPSKIGEMKTKPTQHAVRTLNSSGIQPNFIIARSEQDIDNIRREKIALHCNMNKEDVIAAPDIESIYEIPVNFEKNGLGNKILKKFGLKSRANQASKKIEQKWIKMVHNVKHPDRELKIGLVGKYFASGDFSLTDSYISVIEAIKHAGAYNKIKPKLEWIATETIEKQGLKSLRNLAGIIVPQGWGSRGSEGKIKTIEYCRKNNIPYLGLCYGMQMAVIEFARHVGGLKDANSEEIKPRGRNRVIHIMPGQAEIIESRGYGGTIRLGAWPCQLKPGTKLAQSYKKMGKGDLVYERHRHRYEFNNDFREILTKKGLIISGTSPDGKIVEAIELKNHPFFIGVQFHPEYISRPLDPHPLFVEFLKAAAKNKKSSLG